jgi:ABC-type antimicrobial peptide transport system permease subunit
MAGAPFCHRARTACCSALTAWDATSRRVSRMGRGYRCWWGRSPLSSRLVIGIGLGAIAGYLGGWVDDVVMRFTEFFQTIPSFVLAILLVAIFTPTIQSIVFAIAVVSWPPVARVVRAEFLSLRSREFVQASEVLGKSRVSIVLGDILPNALSPIVVLSSLMVASAILLESALSFLGLGDPNMMSWGFPHRLRPQRHPHGLVDERVSRHRHLPHRAVAQPGG